MRTDRQALRWGTVIGIVLVTLALPDFASIAILIDQLGQTSEKPLSNQRGYDLRICTIVVRRSEYCSGFHLTELLHRSS
jgi:hypothetical protein